MAVIFIACFSLQNLYGLAQQGLMPYRNYEWMTEEGVQLFNPHTVDLNGEIGYILEVDLKYPKNLHNLHNDYPLGPEKFKISYENLSKYSKSEHFRIHGNKNYKSSKLFATLHDKKKYIIHIKNLRLYTDLGLKILKIHRVLKFEQKAFLKDFIRKCTDQRKKATTVFEKNQSKKLANSCYGTTISNIREYISVKLHTSEKSLLKASSKHTYKNQSIIGENLVVTSHFLPEIIHNKPYAVGFTILEYSKHFMYDFYYNKLLKSCGKQNIELLFSDTGNYKLFKLFQADFAYIIICISSTHML